MSMGDAKQEMGIFAAQAVDARVGVLRQAIEALQPGDLRECGIKLVKELMLKHGVNIEGGELDQHLDRLMYYREPMPGG